MFKYWIGLLTKTKYNKVKREIKNNTLVINTKSKEYNKTIEVFGKPNKSINAPNTIKFKKISNIKLDKNINVDKNNIKFSDIIDIVLDKARKEDLSLMRVSNMILYCVKNNAMDANLDTINNLITKLGDELNPLSAYTFFYQDVEVGYITIYVFEYDNIISDDITIN